MAAEHWDVTDDAIDNESIININSAVKVYNLTNKAFILQLYSQFENVIIHHIIADEEYVAVHAELKGDKTIALFDIFRIEDNRITKHHYVKQDVPDKMMHSNGMF